MDVRGSRGLYTGRTLLLYRVGKIFPVFAVNWLAASALLHRPLFRRTTVNGMAVLNHRRGSNYSKYALYTEYSVVVRLFKFNTREQAPERACFVTTAYQHRSRKTRLLLTRPETDRITVHGHTNQKPGRPERKGRAVHADGIEWLLVPSIQLLYYNVSRCVGASSGMLPTICPRTQTAALPSLG